jgi:hypothetical protein
LSDCEIPPCTAATRRVGGACQRAGHALQANAVTAAMASHVVSAVSARRREREQHRREGERIAAAIGGEWPQRRVDLGDAELRERIAHDADRAQLFTERERGGRDQRNQTFIATPRGERGQHGGERKRRQHEDRRPDAEQRRGRSE